MRNRVGSLYALRETRVSGGGIGEFVVSLGMMACNLVLSYNNISEKLVV